ncbi:Ig domain-containing protein [Lactococcus sp. LG606]|nr:Ig domain-containing protein [Lactococcus sp. LG606]
MNKTTLDLKVGDTETLIATVIPEDAEDKTVTFTSSDESIAKVTPKQGKVEALAEGNTTIIGTTSNGLTFECEVVVTTAK